MSQRRGGAATSGKRPLSADDAFVTRASPEANDEAKRPHVQHLAAILGGGIEVCHSVVARLQGFLSPTYHCAHFTLIVRPPPQDAIPNCEAFLGKVVAEHAVCPNRCQIAACIAHIFVGVGA